MSLERILSALARLNLVVLLGLALYQLATTLLGE